MVHKEFSQYARIIDRQLDSVANGYMFHSNEDLLLYLTCAQQYANDMLKCQGKVMLNEVYDALGIERLNVDCSNVGWIYNEKDSKRDNYIDFGIYDMRNKEFMIGDSTKIVLDFNVDKEL